MSGTMIKKFQGLVSFYFPAHGDFAMTWLPMLLLGGAGRINVIFMMKKTNKTRKKHREFNFDRVWQPCIILKASMKPS